MIGKRLGRQCVLATAGVTFKQSCTCRENANFWYYQNQPPILTVLCCNKHFDSHPQVAIVAPHGPAFGTSVYHLCTIFLTYWMQNHLASYAIILLYYGDMENIFYRLQLGIIHLDSVETHYMSQRIYYLKSKTSNGR